MTPTTETKRQRGGTGKKPRRRGGKGRTQAPGRKDLAARWTQKLVADGWTPVSMFFLDHYSQLKPEITSGEAMFIIHLIRHKWTEAPPYPAFKTVAKKMGVSVAAARGYARKLERKRYLERVRRVGDTNKFILDPLFEALENLMDTLETGAD